MKLSELRSLIKEVATELQEANVTGTGASFTPGTGAQYATPKAFAKKNKESRAVKTLTKVGFKKVERPKRPTHTKLIDYLDENDTREV